MTMTRDKIEELKRIAQNAWPGPWAMNPEPFDNDGTPETVVSAMDGKAAICVTMDWGKNNPLMREANALHIAAFDPKTILSLLALAERALEPQGQALDDMYDAIEDTPEAAATFWREEPEPGMPLAVERFTWHLKVQVPPGRANFENLFTARQMIAHGRKCWEAGRASQLALPAAQQLIGAGHFTMGKSGRWAEVDRNVPNSTILYHGPEWPETNADPFSHEERTAADVKYQMMKTSYEAEIKQLRERLDDLAAGPVHDKSALEPQGQALPEDCDVRKIMLRVDPGPDGMGVEVYAKNVGEVEELLSELGDKAEEAYASQLALPAGPVPTDAEFNALRAAAIEACTWLDHANCVNLPVDDDDPDTSMRASMNKLRDLAWKTPRRSASPAGTVPENVRHALNEWADAATSALQWLRNIADGTTTDHQQAIENTLSGIQHAQQVTAAALASPSPAVAQPVADEREEFEKWFSAKYHHRLDRKMADGSYNDPTAHNMSIAWLARAALCQPVEEGGKS